MQQVSHIPALRCMWVIYDKVGRLQRHIPASRQSSLLSSATCDLIRAYCLGNPGHCYTSNSNYVITSIWLLSKLPALSILAVIVLWHQFSPVTISPCPSLLALPASVCITFSYLTSYHFALLVLISGIHFRHLVVWSPLAPMSLPVTRFCVTSEGRTQGHCGNRPSPHASSALCTFSPLISPDCLCLLPFWQLQHRRKLRRKVTSWAADRAYHHQLIVGDHFLWDL